MLSGDLAQEGIDATLIQHISPIEWDNVILYGQYVLDRALVRKNGSLCCISTAIWALPLHSRRNQLQKTVRIVTYESGACLASRSSSLTTRPSSSTSGVLPAWMRTSSTDR